ncbi:hypothetical protein ABIA24_003172 [Sinorhizobium fredii]
MASSIRAKWFGRASKVLADLVDRQPRIGKARHVPLPGKELRQVLQARRLFAIGTIELDDAARHIRRRLGDLDQLLIPRKLAGKQRIGKDLAQLRKTAARLALQFFEIDLVDRGELEKKLHRQRSLVALDEVQVGRRDAERLRHGRLRQLKAVADPSDARSGEDLVLGHLSLPLQIFPQSTFDKIYIFTGSHCQTQDKLTPFGPAETE